MNERLSSEQIALAQHYREKWAKIALCTERIDSQQAIAAVKAAYSVNGFKEPKIYICESPDRGVQKLIELERTIGDLGERLNQRIQHHNRWFRFFYQMNREYFSRTLQTQLQEHLSESLDYLYKLDRFTERKLEENLYPTEEEEENPELQALSERLTTMFNDPSVDDEQKLIEGRQAMAYIENISRGTMRPLLFHNIILPSILAADYCQWDFCFSVLKLPHRPEEWETSEALLKTCGWIFPFKKVCVICDRPTKISLDEKRQLHASGKPAIEFSDGYCVYAYRGALQTEPLNPSLNELELAEKYQQETNPRLRQAIVESYSVENLDVNWLFMESDFQVREILFQKLGSERILASLQDSDPFGLLPQALTEDAGSLLWVVYALLQNREEPCIAKFISDPSSPTTNLKQLRASLMKDSLETIVAWLQQYASNFAEDFLPGLDEEEIFRRLEQLPFKVPKEVYELYQWRNGISSERMLFVYHDFLELDRAMEELEALTEYMPEHERDNDPAYLFPLFEFEGEYFAVAGGNKVVETAPVYHISEIFEVTLVFNSITTMMLALAESYERGCYRAENLDEFGSVDVDLKQLVAIRHKYNPGTIEQIYADGG